jgi:lipid A 4'-phosphatase
MASIASKVLSVLRSPFVWVPALVLAAATVLFRCTDLDMATVQPFFAADGSGSASDAHWPLKAAQPWKGLYDWGEYPALLIGGGGMLVWIVSFFWKRIESWRDPGFFLALLLMLGPGLIVNVLIKPCWARPRPNGTLTLGGQSRFVPVWQLGEGTDDWSFPSGHAAMGFYLMAPAFICYRRRPGLAAGFMLLGLASGTVMGIARIVAGCHFPSDVLWAGGVVYFTALVLAAPFRFGLGAPVWNRSESDT